MQFNSIAANLRTNPAPRGARVLLIDPDPASARESDRRLRAAGFDVVVISSAARAMRLVKAETFDAILCEIQLARMDGFEFRDALLRDPATARIRFSFLAAEPHLEDHSTANRLGAGILAKPVELAALRAQSAATPHTPAPARRFDAIIPPAPPATVAQRPVGEPDLDLTPPPELDLTPLPEPDTGTIFHCSVCARSYRLGEELTDDRLLVTCPDCL